jgi:hypothetical protein
LDVEDDFVEQGDGVVVDFFLVFTVYALHFAEDGPQVVHELFLVGTGEGEEAFERFDFEDGGAFRQALHQEVVVVGVKGRQFIYLLLFAGCLPHSANASALEDNWDYHNWAD